MMRQLLSLALLAACACSAPFESAPAGDATSTSLIDMTAWRALPAAADPLAEHRPERVSCPSAAWRLEAGQLEVQTGVCNYFAVDQPSLLPLASGDRLKLEVWHEALDASEPAMAHVALLLGSELLVEADVAIPSEARLHTLEVGVKAAAPAGTPLVLHLHNHGFNSWTFESLARLP
jgi:hypothetical protein